ncbi:MAG: YkgJ family cysteine cluster protein [Desulfovibrionaceae bacterium]
MAFDLSPYFERYENIAGKVDEIFAAIQEKHSEQVACGKGCSDCCHALFDLSLIEALYINHHFNKKFSGLERSEIMDRADEADRSVHRLKRQAFRASQDGKSTQEILLAMAEAKVRCPLLGKDDLCELYEHRPLTCRLYGVPLNIGGEPHSCGKSGFEPGTSYATVHVEKLQDALLALSYDLTQGIGSSYKELGSVLVPLSMALLTEYDETYLGVNRNKAPAKAAVKSAPEASAEKADACGSCSKDESACASCKEKSFNIVLGKGPDEKD